MIVVEGTWTWHLVCELMGVTGSKTCRGFYPVRDGRQGAAGGSQESPDTRPCVFVSSLVRLA